MADLEQAVAQVEAGDAAAFRTIVAATSERLVRAAARLVGGLADAEDVVQEAYLKAYRSIVGGGFDGRAKVETWLFRIVANQAIDQLRRRGRSRTVDDEALEIAGSGAGQLEAHVALKELDALFSGLPAEQRVAMILKSVEGLSSAEIAEVMECSEGAVEQRLVRARAALRERLGA